MAGNPAPEWHASEALIASYVRGDVDNARAASFEAHVMACPTCQARVAPAADQSRLALSWAGIEDAADRPRPTRLERVLVRGGVRDDMARVLAVTPAFRRSWFAAAASAVVFAGLAVRISGNGKALLAFLVAAPLLPVAGVAAAFGPRVDPTHELSVASPLGAFRLVLLRSVAVVATAVVVAGLASLSLPGLEPIAAAWLVPALGLSIASLAVATYVDPVTAAGWVAGAWVAGVLVSEAWAEGGLRMLVRSGPIESVVFQPVGQVAFAALAACAALVLARRHGQLELTTGSRGR